MFEKQWYNIEIALLNFKTELLFWKLFVWM